MPLKSPVKHVAITQRGRTFEILRFKYADSSGKVADCEMPAVEAREKRLPPEWIQTFDLYKVEAEATTTKQTKKTIERLYDFPLVSPPPRSQPAAPPGSGYPQGGYMPGAPGTLMPPGGYPGTPGQRPGG